MSPKLSVCFIALVYLVGCSIASPASIPRIRRYVAAENPPSPAAADLEKSLKHLETEFQNSLKTVTNNADFVFQNLAAIVRNMLREGILNVATWAVDLVTRIEFLIMADGSHFVFPLNSKADVEEEHKTIAIAVSKLLMNLKTMERADLLITNATRTLLSGDIDENFAELKSSNVKSFRKFLEMYFQALSAQFEADHELAGEYKTRKAEAKERVKEDPKMHDAFVKAWETGSKLPTVQEVVPFLQNKNVYREAFANKIFLKQAVKHFAMVFNVTHHKRYLLARALISVAQSSNDEVKVNEIYHRALTVAGGMAYVKEDDGVISDVLFNSITKRLELEPTTRSEVDKLMREIEKNTVYDIDMLQVDFSLL